MNAVVQPKPVSALDCTCWHVVDNQGCIQPALCPGHADELARRDFHWVTVKYQRWFETEADARDRAQIIRDRWGEGYGTTVSIIPISRWYLLRADWSDSCD